MDSDVVRRLVWAGMLAATGALASVIAHRAASMIYTRVFDEDPPD